MALIKSISGIRGTVGGKAGEGLSPLDVVKFTAAYATWLASPQPPPKEGEKSEKMKIVVGRDARISGEMVNHLVIGTLLGMGFDVVNIGMATTPTTELAVVMEKAAGGIIITASHNPKQWNALKLLNNLGEFLNAKEGEEVLAIAESAGFHFAEVDEIGNVTEDVTYGKKHIEKVLSLDLVHVESIYKANFTVAIDCVNSVGGIVLPELLAALGVNNVIQLNCTPNGQFPHNPEPLPQHLTEISNLLKNGDADVGFVVDPDVDRLAIVCEDGAMFGEEYTLVSVADYVLSKTPGNTVSNMSSTRALRDVTQRYGGTYTASAVGEVNVVTAMKATNAVIGGEGNGGVIYPACHYGRDALAGIALFLTNLAQKEMKVSELRATYPAYFMAKKRMDLTPTTDVNAILKTIQADYAHYPVSTIDGVKIDFPDGWVHLRKSNTEPIIRIYSEASTPEQADRFGDEIIEKIKRLT